MKSLAIIISGLPAGDNVREAEIQPGTTAGDVLKAMNLTGYLLSKEGSAQAFAAEENLFDAVSDGEKLRATPLAEVGSFPTELWAALLAVFGLKQRVQIRNVVQTQRPDKRPVPPRGNTVRVTPDERPLWQVRGWRNSGNKMVGPIACRIGARSPEKSS